MPSNAEMRCRVCGLLQSDPPWGSDGKTPSFDICDCCGVEFGYEDAAPAAVARYRAEWLAKGAPWFAPESRPGDWNLDEQLKRVPVGFR